MFRRWLHLRSAKAARAEYLGSLLVKPAGEIFKRLEQIHEEALAAGRRQKPQEEARLLAQEEILKWVLARGD